MVNIISRAGLFLRVRLGGELQFFRFFVYFYKLFFYYFWRCLPIATSSKELSINNQIKAAQVRVIDDLGNQAGVLKTKDALNMALEKGLDLVEIAPTAEIPVCRIMDYGKYKFEKSKKDKEAKKKQKQVIIETKETQLSWNIDIHDFNTRLNQTKKFIEAGNKVKISLELNKGREMAHMELGYQMLDKFEQACLDFCVVEKRPIREGRRISMFIGPKKVKPEEKPRVREEKESAPEKSETKEESKV